MSAAPIDGGPDPSPSSQPSAAISVESVSFSYRAGLRALRDVDLRFAPGEFAAIVGNNGSGKSTLMKLLVGLLKPTAGRIVVDGTDTRGARVSALARRVGFIFQNPNDQLFANTVADEIRFGLRNLGLSPAEVEERLQATLARFGLQPVQDTFPRFLSRGDKQKVCIAAVVAMRPRILLLDEPTTGQDHRDSQAIMELARGLNEQGITVLLVTHDLINVAAYTRRTVVLRDGVVVRDGTTAAVMSDLDLLASCSLAPPQIVRLALRVADLGLPLALSVDAMVQATVARLGQDSPP
jgi:energy-coupling factor transporter ATP-binding protein EcfA2